VIPRIVVVAGGPSPSVSMATAAYQKKPPPPPSSSTESFAEISLLRKVAYSGISGAIATTCIYPIDITKTKLMDQKTVGKAVSETYSGPFDVVRKILRKEGIPGMFRGWPPNVIFVMPEKAIKLTLNDYLRQRFRESRPQKDLPLQYEMLAGGLAGFCQVVVTCPMEVLKIQGATVTEKIKSGELKEKIGYLKLARNLSFTGLYTGVISTLARDVPFSIVYFSLYAQTKSRLVPPGVTAATDPNIGVKAFAAGAIAGTVAAALTCPLDVVKTRVHSAAKPIRLNFSEYLSREFLLLGEHTKNIWNKEGIPAFFKGIIPRCLIISPLFAITMACYEKMQKTFH